MTQNDRYERLIALLDANAAKCIIAMIKGGKKVTLFVLAVIPGDRRVDLDAVKTLKGGTYAGFAPPERAEELAGSVMGTVLPFANDPRLELIADPAIKEHDEIFFNAARLDRSICLRTEDYIRLANPRFRTAAWLLDKSAEEVADLRAWILPLCEGLGTSVDELLGSAIVPGHKALQTTLYRRASTCSTGDASAGHMRSECEPRQAPTLARFQGLISREYARVNSRAASFPDSANHIVEKNRGKD